MAQLETSALSKGQRAVVLLDEFRKCSELARSLDWRGALLLRDGQLLVEQDGALFHARDETRFFRDSGRGIARAMRRTLKGRRIPVSTVFDVGANIGEVAISFASKFPHAKIYAFEPAPENLLRLDANIALQPAMLANLTVVREAVSDRRGEIEMTVGADCRNTTVLDFGLERTAELSAFQIARVPTDTLENYCVRFGVDQIDFLKVDIEGGEPLLGESVRKLGGHIGSALVEMSRFNSLDAYLELVDAFTSGGLVLEDHESVPVADPRAFLDEQLERLTTVNLWFLPPL
jgi:FkbM family methyltransferase